MSKISENFASPKAPSVQDYFDAIKNICDIEMKTLTAVLPHYGERGANAEEIVKRLLRRILPHQYSIGTGFIICSDPTIPSSNQTDIVIFDEFKNSPLHRELSALIYPIEIIYATMEVKSGEYTDKEHIRKFMESTGKIRDLARHKRYIQHTDPDKSTDERGDYCYSRVPFTTDIPPMAFFFAYDVRTDDIRTFSSWWEECLKEIPNSRLDAAIVLKKDWFISRGVGDRADYIDSYDDNSLLRFVSCVLEKVGRFKMHQMSACQYLSPFEK